MSLLFLCYLFCRIFAVNNRFCIQTEQRNCATLHIVVYNCFTTKIVVYHLTSVHIVFRAYATSCYNDNYVINVTLSCIAIELLVGEVYLLESLRDCQHLEESFTSDLANVVFSVYTPS